MCSCIYLIESQWSRVGFKFGIKVGLSQADYGIKELLINDPNSFKIDITNTEVGFHGGITLQLKINKLIIQPEFLLNSSKVNYKLSGNLPNSLDTLLASETFRDLDIPLMIGFKSGALRLNVGPVGHLHLNSTSDLTKIDGYEENFKKLLWGWQAGMGFDFWILTIDLRYEGNFSKFGNHIKFGNKNYSFSDNPQRLIASLGVAF
ncbi:MAG: PorT family protein [Saprospiraceae bacterium]|nr:porin family protein [Candidatus Brachybacter algidus]MBL0118725.1 PorT family protein [Candidatus Brachybacter algidus]